MFLDNKGKHVTVTTLKVEILFDGIYDTSFQKNQARDSIRNVLAKAGDQFHSTVNVLAIHPNRIDRKAPAASEDPDSGSRTFHDGEGVVLLCDVAAKDPESVVAYIENTLSADPGLLVNGMKAVALWQIHDSPLQWTCDVEGHGYSRGDDGNDYVAMLSVQSLLATLDAEKMGRSLMGVDEINGKLLGTNHPTRETHTIDDLHHTPKPFFFFLPKTWVSSLM